MVQERAGRTMVASRWWRPRVIQMALATAMAARSQRSVPMAGFCERPMPSPRMKTKAAAAKIRR